MSERGDHTRLRRGPRSGLPAALLCGVLSFCCCLLRAGEPVISEFLASNSRTLLDADDEATDWIEIHNPGPGVARLDGWHLSDDPDDLTRWTFPAETVLEADQYLVVFASGKNRLTATENFSERASSEFAHALEFNSGAFPEIEGATDGWTTRGLLPDAPEPPTVSVGDGVLSFDTLGVRGSGSLRLGPANTAWNEEVDRGISYTIEVRVRVTGEGGEVPGFNLWSGNGNFDHSMFLSVGMDQVVYGRSSLEPELASILHLGDNSTDFVTIRVAQDGTTGKTYVWRNGELIGRRLGRGLSSSRRWLLLIDHGNASECQGELDYVRWDASGAYLPPGTRLLPELHTNFRLAASGEFLALVSPDGATPTTFFAPAFPEQKTDISYGPEGYYLEPTPGRAQTQAFRGFALPPEFSVERGFFDEPFEVRLTSASEGAQLLFTTDGSTPGIGGAGTLATDPIVIDGTTVLRAVALSDELAPSRVVAHSYLFVSDVLEQTGEGLPVNPAWHYEVDPAVVRDPRFAGLRDDHLKTLPSISLSLPVEAMFGPQGIHAHPEQTGMAWERECSVEFVDPAGEEAFELNAGLRVQGAGSRFRPQGKKSFRVAFRDIYGFRKLEHPVFGPDGAREFNSLVLRGNYFDSFSVHLPGDGESIGWLSALLLRDRFAYLSQWATGNHSLRGRWVHLYINGLYWGLYNLTERPDEHFAASHFGDTPDDYDVLKQRPRGEPNGSSPEVVHGDLEAWDELLAVVTAELDADSYARVGEMLDLVSFVDYVLLNLYGGNQDWPHNNWYAIRNRRSGGPFRFISWDAENYIWRLAEDGKLHTNVNNSPGILYDRLRRYPDFRRLFATRVELHLGAGGAFSPERALARFDGIVAEIREAMDGESARWGGTRVEEPLNTIDTWLETVEDKRRRYFPQRTSIVLDQLRSVELASPRGPSGVRRAGDANGDGLLNLADAVALIGHLHVGVAIPLPCGDGTLTESGNRRLLDTNGDTRTDLSDVVYLLDHLFRRGPAPAGGAPAGDARCVEIEGCSSAGCEP